MQTNGPCTHDPRAISQTPKAKGRENPSQAKICQRQGNRLDRDQKVTVKRHLSMLRQKHSTYLSCVPYCDESVAQIHTFKEKLIVST